MKDVASSDADTGIAASIVLSRRPSLLTIQLDTGPNMNINDEGMEPIHAKQKEDTIIKKIYQCKPAVLGPT